MWTKPISFGGIAGGNKAIYPDMTFYSGTAYQLKFANPIIMYGNVYYSVPLANQVSGLGVTCVDLRTGETKWTRPDINSVAFGQFIDFESPNQHGINPNGYLWYSTTIIGTGILNPNAAAIAQQSGNYNPGESVGANGSSTNNNAVISQSGWAAIDPMTGANVFNQTNVPGGTRAIGPLGEVLLYNIGRRNNTSPYTYLTQWNNTKFPGQDSPTAITAWTPGNRNINMTAGYDWNVTLSQELPSTSSVVRVFPDNFIFGTSSTMQQTSATSSGVFGTPDPFTLWAINLNKTRGAVGQVMWIRDYPAPEGNKTAMIGPTDGETNVFTMYYRETMQWVGYDALTGNQIWGPTASEDNWNYYGGTTGLTAPYATGYGNLYSAGFSGIVYCYDFKTGELEFTYGNNANDPFNSTRTTQTVYGDYPYQIAAVANNKIYMVPCEHSLDSPPYHGASIRCIDAFSGKEMWKFYGMSSWQMQAVADGYYTFLNLNDMQIYSVGAGPSSTSVSVQDNVVALGGSVLITGSVVDESPALKGTAAIADLDQGPWVEYMIQKNRVKPDVDGVPVKLTAIDPNGNFQDIGTVLSDSSGLFHKLWQPPVEGEYVITAEFVGSQSYGPSTATTAIAVTAAPAPSVTPTQTPTPTPTGPASPTPTPVVTPSPTEVPVPGGLPESTIYAIAAAIVVVLIVAVAALVLRKRK
jgi:outer membrane protein assembly factor BamB